MKVFRIKIGGVAEWLKAADCKSARVSVRRFESYPHHHSNMNIITKLKKGHKRCLKKNLIVVNRM